MTNHFIEPDWPAPSRVLALSSTRKGGASKAPWASLNLGHHVGDDPAAVAANRDQLLQQLPAGAAVRWLQQVHGTEVQQAGAGIDYPEADASWSRKPGLACAVMTADCLPVLFCDRAASVVAAAHAGWRGLAAGVLEATIEAMAVPSGQLMAWLGPAIGPGRFEVGAEVREQFLASQGEAAALAFAAATRPGHFYADIYQLARQRLAAAGLTAIYGGDRCTFDEPRDFFSYRRDGQTGRMASLIMLLPT